MDPDSSSSVRLSTGLRMYWPLLPATTTERQALKSTVSFTYLHDAAPSPGYPERSRPERRFATFSHADLHADAYVYSC